MTAVILRTQNYDRSIFDVSGDTWARWRSNSVRSGTWSSFRNIPSLTRTHWQLIFLTMTMFWTLSPWICFKILNYEIKWMMIVVYCQSWLIIFLFIIVDIVIHTVYFHLSNHPSWWSISQWLLDLLGESRQDKSVWCAQKMTGSTLGCCGMCQNRAGKWYSKS